MQQSQCAHVECGKDDYIYNNYEDNEVSPQIRRPDFPIHNELQGEYQPEIEPEPLPQPEAESQHEAEPQPVVEHHTENEPQHDDKQQLTLSPIDSNTFGPAVSDLYDEYTGVSLADVLRDKHSGKDYYYLYVGVPKNSVNEFKNTLLKAGVQSNI